MRKSLITLTLLVSLAGCASFKKDVGDYVSDAVTKSVEKKIDEKLSVKGLSIADIRSALDINGDGQITKAEVISTLKDAAKDGAVIEVTKVVDAKLAEVEARMASKNDVASNTSSMWNYILVSALGAVSAYLHKHFQHNSRLVKIETALFGGNDAKANKDANNKAA